MLLIGAIALALPVLADTGGSASASLIIIGVPEEVQTSSEVAGGGGGVADCEPLCPPPIPALYATKRADLAEDLNDDGVIDPGDSLRYTMLVTNFAPVPMFGVDYVEIIDPHVRLIPGSWEVTKGNVTTRDFDGTQVFVYLVGSLDTDEVVIFSFEVRVADDLASGVNELVGQGVVYADTTSPIVTDNPDTMFLQDATRTPIGGVAPIILAAGGGASAEESAAQEPTSDALKGAKVVPDPKILRVVAHPEEVVEYGVGFVNTTAQPLMDVRLVDLVGPHMRVQTDSLTPASARVWTFGELQVVVANIDLLEPGETAVLGYKAAVHSYVPPEIAYTATRAIVSSNNGITQLSDDPLTQLHNDPTAVLFPYQCVGDAWTWDDWLDVVSEAPTGLLPLVMQEKDESQHLRWVLYGGDFFGDLSNHPSVRPPYWSEWALAGLVDVPFTAAKDSDLGFRLAQREEPYVESFLAAEPLFMWTEYGMPLYGRVPATDTGELLLCDGFNREFCDRGYLPLLVQLNWSENWDMRWLEDHLIVATVTEGGMQP
jgi:uncharacterized repeat protein (TIGR01451 family)